MTESAPSMSSGPLWSSGCSWPGRPSSSCGTTPAANCPASPTPCLTRTRPMLPGLAPNGPTAFGKESSMYSAAAMPGTPGNIRLGHAAATAMRSGPVRPAPQRPAVQAQHGIELLGLLDVAGYALGDPEVPAEVGAVRIAAGWQRADHVVGVDRDVRRARGLLPGDDGPV